MTDRGLPGRGHRSRRRLGRGRRYGWRWLSSLIWPRISPAGNVPSWTLTYVAPARIASTSSCHSPAAIPCADGPTTFAAVIVPVIVPDVELAGQLGRLPPPQMHADTPPPSPPSP